MKILAFLVLPLVLFSQEISEKIFQDDGGFQYGLVLPVQYNPNKKYILGICLHGLGGSGLEIAQKLGLYTRYMNIILACPNGNIPDEKRNATRWGYAESTDYLLSFIRYVQGKFNHQGKIALFGYSLGGNQGIYMVSEYPEIFSHFVGISGGYSSLSESQLESIDPNLKILLISGDTGAGEIYTKNALDKRYKELKSHELNVSRKVLKGQEHEINYKLSYNALKWFAKSHSFYKSNFWIFRGDFYPYYLKANLQFQEGNYIQSMQSLKKSLRLNPIFPPSHFLYLRSCLRAGNMTGLNKTFFATLQFYSSDPFYENKEIFSFFVEFRKTIFNDKSLKEFYIRFLGEKILEVEDVLLPIYTAEIYYLLTYFAYDLQTEDFKNFLNKTKYYYSQIGSNEPEFSKARVSKKLEWLESLKN